MTHAHTHKTFLPAFGRDFLLPLYDPFTRLIGAHAVLRSLVDGAELRRGHAVLDIGCGTGTLLLHCKRQHPDVSATGIDPDPKALARARKKAERAALSVKFDHGYGDALPYDDGSFDRVFCSMMLHHLDPPDKAALLAEAARVLKPGGRLELVDFVGPQDVERGVLQRWLHGNERMRDNGTEQVLSIMRDAGLAEPRVVSRSRLLLGTVAFYRAQGSG
jgi:ubiquinone/menaquinone biosynthesis C-methylase UbiE